MIYHENGAPVPPAERTYDYDIGYKKPPKHSQFKDGVSGNPRGRPPKAKNSDDRYLNIQRLLNQKAKITLNGRRWSLSMHDVCFAQVLAKAATTGDTAAWREVDRMANRLEGQRQTDDNEKFVLIVED